MSSRASRAVEQIAIIGLACRFPRASNPTEYWQNLIDGVDCITRFGPEERERSSVWPEIPGERVLAQGIVDGIESFDAALFGFSDNESLITDPQQRLALEVAWSCLLDAGCDARRHKGSIGAFTGCGVSTYLLGKLLADPAAALVLGSVPLLLRNDKDQLATLLAYKLGLTGPAVNVGCGCSSGLAAIHFGVQHLLTRQCDMALCGAASLLVPQRQGHIRQNGSIYSTDGYCRPFDDGATGTVGGGGVGFVALKRLEDALCDGDRIYATVMGSAINNDGAAKVGYSAPSVDRQAAAVMAALHAAGVDASTISLVEAHGTGTTMGDPIEVEALSLAFRQSTQAKGYCALGSVKSNIGHLDTASGVAGFIKTALALKHAVIPATLHFSHPNRNIEFEQSPFYVNVETQPWKPRAGVRRAGVNCLGIGGTNVHLVLGEHAHSSTKERWTADHYLFPLSAHSEASLTQTCRTLADEIRAGRCADLGTLAYSLATRRPSMRSRTAVIASSCEELAQALTQTSRESTAATAPLQGLADSWCSGADVDWKALYGEDDRWQVCALPEYAFVRRRFWFEPRDARGPQHRGESVGLLGEKYLELSDEAHYRPMSAYPGLIQSLDDLCVAFMMSPLQKVFCEDSPATAEELASRLQVHPRWRRFFDAILDALVERGTLSRQADRLALERPHVSPSQLDETATALVLRYPAFQDLIVLIRTLAGPLAHHWRDPVAGPESFSAASRSGLLQRALSTPAPSFSNTEACSRLAAVFVERLARAQGPLRVLEVGAGDLQLTQFMEAPIQSGQVEYWITDIDPSRVARAAQVITQRGLSGAHAAMADITRPLSGQGGIPEAFDVVVALNVVHVCPNVDRALTNMRNVLTPDGHLIVLETVEQSLWQTLIWGWAEGWWSFDDARRRYSPLLRREAWESALVALRPTTITSFPEASAAAEQAQTHIWIARFAPQPKVTATSTGNRPGRLYHPVFTRRSIAAQFGASRRMAWIVLEDPSADLEPLIQQMQRSGTVVARVRPGEAFQQLDTSCFEVACASRPGFEQLLAAVGARLTTDVGIVYAGERWDPRAENAGFYTLLALAQALSTSQAHQWHLLALTTGLYDVLGSETLDPDQALIQAAVKVIPQEYSNIRCRLIDLERLPHADDELTWSALFELCRSSAAPQFAALRGRNYWVPECRPVDMPDVPDHLECRVRQQGVYVIFGGLGGVGFAVASRLAQQLQARLILVGRSAKVDDPATDAKLAELRRLGGQCAVFAADVAVRSDVEAALCEAERRFGPINGVIHSAGDIDRGGVIQGRSFEQITALLAVKTAGARNLAAALESRRPDFLIFFASLGSTLYKLKFGEIGYVAGSDFITAFAQSHARRSPYLTQVVQWPDWQQGGMRIRAEAEFQRTYLSDADSPEQVALAQELLPLSNEEGSDAFLRALESGYSCLIVSTGSLEHLLDLHRQYETADYARLLERANLRKRSPPESASQPARAVSVTATPVDTFEALRDIWQEVLGCPVRDDDDFFHLGGDSLLALRVIARVTEVLAVSLPLAAFFSTKDLNAMAQYVKSLGGSPTNGTAQHERLH